MFSFRRPEAGVRMDEQVLPSGHQQLAERSQPMLPNTADDRRIPPTFDRHGAKNRLPESQETGSELVKRGGRYWD